MTIEVGSTITGTVIRVADYGAVVRLPGGQTGLVHISEIADAYVRNVRDYVREEDEVTVKVLALNPRGRYELSMKRCGTRVASSEEGKLVGAGVAHGDDAAPRRPREEFHRVRLASFEDRLSKFLKDSEERQHDLKRHIESKRGRR